VSENDPAAEARQRLEGSSVEALLAAARNVNQTLVMRTAALELLVQSGDSRAVKAVSQIIRSERKHALLRADAIFAASRLPIAAPEIIDALAHVLRNGTKQDRRRAADTLGELGDASAIEALSDVLQQSDVDADTKSAAVRALGTFETSRAHFARAMSILTNVLQSRSYETKVRANAAWALGEFRRYDSISTLQAVAESEDESLEVREAAIASLAGLAHRATQESMGVESLTHLRPSGSYILTPAMHGPDWDEAQERWRRYRHYLESIRDKLPEGARQYAFSPNHNCPDRECPHDSWLEEVRLEVRSWGDRHQYRGQDIHTRFLGSYHDGYIEFHYRNVYDYLLAGVTEWMYDEVRLGEDGHVIHEIRFDADTHWLIECDDFTFEWKPFDK
jgi:HEAT repeats/PBS lyase HEAT-like repeat